MNVFRRYVTVIMAILGFACSTTEVNEQHDPIPEVPNYVKVPHPSGFEMADLRAIFFTPLAPKDALNEFSQTCDSELRKFMEVSKSIDELTKASAELVQHDPERAHWCFYSKIEKLQEFLQGDSYWSQRQAAVLKTFEYLDPVANAFLKVYQDSRYLIWAAQYYQKISEWVFFRKVEPTPESTLQFVISHRTEVESFAQQQQPQSNSDSMFAKYGITLAPTVAGGMAPIEQPAMPGVNLQTNMDAAQVAQKTIAPAAPEPAIGPAPASTDAAPALPANPVLEPPAPDVGAPSAP